MKKLTKESIREYGRIIQGDCFGPLFEKMQCIEYPAEGIEYVMSSKALEEETIKQKVEETIYGGMPVQIGYCIGKNKSLNALEYHRSPEINIAVDDMILLLGRLQDVEMDFSYDTSRLEAFYVPAGTAVELYATTLHYVPCAAKGDTFRSIVVLPKDTNQTLAFEVEREGENQLLMAQNKWLIAHEEAGIEGAFCGLQGENITFL
ncbi:DUF4867 family protein [Dorea phocaeensis]|uniref:DUF4867 family protein n=1 Tax=Dorea phocaeensis TaxID=2040291 RepID=A0A850HKB2_9FIRM|nr:DUF4867 family protein [Dorea phocaeensis]NVH58661.1 DUF4867 family protein [Dorea phocaeensis]